MERVLVTGATGLVGSWLLRELLARGTPIATLVVDRPADSIAVQNGDLARTHVMYGRIERYEDVERAILTAEPDTVYHLAAQTLVGAAYRSPLATFEANIRGTWNLLDACRRLGVRRVVVASSDKAYGDQAPVPCAEEAPLAGRYPYDVSKSCVDLLAQAYHHTYQLPVNVARCGNVYGGGDLNWSRIVPGTIRSLIRNERPVIRSDGSLVREYIYVKDIVAAYLALADTPGAGLAYNFGHGRGYTVLETVRAIQKVMGKEHLEPDVRNTARAEIPVQTLEASKAKRELGWQPRYDLPTGLSETVAWYQEHLR